MNLDKRILVWVGTLFRDFGIDFKQTRKKIKIKTKTILLLSTVDNYHIYCRYADTTLRHTLIQALECPFLVVVKIYVPMFNLGYRERKRESELTRICTMKITFNGLIIFKNKKTLSDRKWCVRAAQIKCASYFLFSFFLFDILGSQKKSFSITMSDFIATSNSIRHQTWVFVYRVQIEWNGPVSERVCE